jgi:ornithine decarboxylase
MIIKNSINQSLPKLDNAIDDKILNFLNKHQLETPFLIMNLDIITENYLTISQLLPSAQIYYAMKANPAPEIMNLLVKLGSSFDVASPSEIDQCIQAGAKVENISYGNTIKKSRDIAYAYELGVRLFAFDSISELEKIAINAPGSHVYCRLLINCENADWPLSRKFGCELDMAFDLLLHSQKLGLVPCGVSFHVGSQQTDPSQWEYALAKTAMLFQALKAEGVNLSMVNLGGGFPAKYKTATLSVKTYTVAIMAAMHRHFGNDIPQIMIEPGRSLVADAGVIQTEVVLISQKSYEEDKRWVYLDIGKFGGLAETMDECIKYRIRTPGDGSQMTPVIIAGPTCDSADILYEKANYELPVNLKVGDQIQILSAGAYTSTYASVGFNGFPPLKTYCI